MTTPSFSEPAFLERLRAREERAVRDVVRAYLPQTLRAARAAGLTDDEAKDASQAAFVVFFEKLPEFEGRSHIRTWLFGILYKKIQEGFRGRRRENEHDDIDGVLEARFSGDGHWSRPPENVEREIESRELGRDIQDCLEGVPDKQRVAFLMREVQGFTTDELCNILSVTVTNLGVMLYRARNRLRECLESKGVGSSAST